MLTPAEIRDAATAIAGRVIRTPVVYSPTFSAMTGARVYLKLENLQKGGSFKVRGATFMIHTLKGRIGPRGVIAASAGNHAQGVAIAARDAGISATIVMPEWVSISKEAATRCYGADVILYGHSLDESIGHARERESAGYTFIHPFDEAAVIAGQGTVGLEICEDLPDTDMIIVPVGGGGLIAGIATAAKAHNREIRVIGAEALSCPSYSEAKKQGRPVRVPVSPSIADGIMVNPVGDLPFSVMQALVDDVVLVDEPDIIRAVNLVLERKKVLAEGAGVVGLAALLAGLVPVTPGSTVVVVISGGNIDSPLLDRILRHGLLASDRILHLSVTIDDEAGTLARLLALIAGERANILHIRHTRSDRSLPLRTVRMEIELETRGAAHNEAIVEAVRHGGYDVGPAS
ncbi:MAG: threonine dehydratase [Methanoculleus sp. SDB]|nr:MAG: threonine dehydratase [Methanoculleus sp. SDB]